MILSVDAPLKCGALDTKIECNWKASWGHIAIGYTEAEY